MIIKLYRGFLNQGFIDVHYKSRKKIIRKDLLIERMEKNCENCKDSSKGLKNKNKKYNKKGRKSN